MELIGIDPDDRAIFFMQGADVKSVLPVMGIDVIVEFIPEVWSA